MDDREEIEELLENPLVRQISTSATWLGIVIGLFLSFAIEIIVRWVSRTF